MQHSVERYKYSSVSVHNAIVIPIGLQKALQLSIALEPHRGCSEKTQDRPRLWRQRTVRLKRATQVTLLMYSVKHFLAMPFSSTLDFL